MIRYSVIGAGSWGTAIANTIANKSNEKVYLWSRELEVVDTINNFNENKKFLPDVKLNKLVNAENNIKNAISEIAFITVPAQYIRNILKNYLEIGNKIGIKKDNFNFVICSKGIEINSGLLLSEIISSLNKDAKIAVLSGPSFARPVASGLPTAVTIASKNKILRKKIISIVGCKLFRPYESEDIIGVQIIGALKNILAIASGITDGLGLEENARAAIITRGIKEIVALSNAMGGKSETILSLSGIGDIILTCTSESSRNYFLGKSIGLDGDLSSMEIKKSSVTEGVHTSKAIFNLIKKYKLDLPIMESVNSILNKEKNVREAVNQLLERPFTKDYLES